MTTNETTTRRDSALAERAVARARAAFTTGRTRDTDWRLRQLEGMDRFLVEREPEIIAAIAQDLGRNAFDAWYGEIAGTRPEIAYARKHLKGWMKPQRCRLPMSQQPGRAWVQPEPLGTVLIIGPWNYPIFLTLSPLVGAIAAGNTVVVKPSELAPAASALLAEHLPRYLDPDAIVVVQGDGAITQDLLAQGLDHAFFTGGTEVGKKVMAAAAPHLTPVTLELGGKCPVVVDESADLDVVARRIALVKLVNSGQTCIAPDYVLAHRAIRDDLIERLSTVYREFRSGETEYAQRIVNTRQFDRLSAALEVTKAKIVSGGATDREALTIEPTILIDPDPAEPLMSEEIFGPILPVVTVDSIDEAFGFVNARPKPLAAYLFSGNKATIRRFVAEVPAGGTVINHLAMHVLVPSLPFGGVGPSGMGSYHGRAGFDTFSHRKSVLAKRMWPDPRMIYPPRTESAVRLIRRMF